MSNVPNGFHEAESAEPTNLAAEVANLTHAVAELTATVSRLGVEMAAVSTSAQHAENAGTAAFNAVTSLDQRLSGMASDFHIVAESCKTLAASAARSEAHAVASYELTQTLSKAFRDKQPTERPERLSKPPNSQ